LIHQIQSPKITQAWYADDAQAAGDIYALRGWWDSIITHGKKYGYFANPKKTVLVVKPAIADLARSVFANTDITICDGARDLGAAIGNAAYRNKYVEEKISKWTEQVLTLSKIAQCSPQAAYSAFVYGLRNRWTYLQRTIPSITPMFHKLEDSIRNNFIPALLGGRFVTDSERDLLSLPCRLGGLALENPMHPFEDKYQNSKKATQQLANLIKKQEKSLNIDSHEQLSIKKTIKKTIEEKQKNIADAILETLPSDLKRAVLVSQEKGASSFLTALPLQRHGFALSKCEFRDAILMRYRWPLPQLPSVCACGKPFTLDHSQICHLGGFVNMRHDEIRDILAEEMREVLRDVQTEPMLQSLSGETFERSTINRNDDARSDIRARGFWMNQQNAFFDVRIFYPHAQSYSSRSLGSLYKSFENEKRAQYEDRILQVEHGTFTPLIFSSSGGMSTQTAISLKKIATMVATQKKQKYNQTITLLRTRLSFALVRAATTCLRGSRCRSTYQRSMTPPDVVLHEAHCF
jgi:hypothetical protein